MERARARDIEGKVTRVGASKPGGWRVSNFGRARPEPARRGEDALLRITASILDPPLRTSAFAKASTDEADVTCRAGASPVIHPASPPHNSCLFLNLNCAFAHPNWKSCKQIM